MFSFKFFLKQSFLGFVFWIPNVILQQASLNLICESLKSDASIFGRQNMRYFLPVI